jgi:competence protein ComEA
VAVAIAVGAALLVASQQGGQVEVVSGPGASAGLDAGASASGSAEPGATQSILVVEVAGAVAHPGIYSLPVGARVADAIRAAGGYSPDVDPRAAESQLNLAARIVDAQAIHVPRRGEAAAAPASSGTAPASGGAAQASPGPMNLNTATAEQLDTLPGVGPVTAQKIIAAREQQPFRKVDDLVTRKIVPASTLAKFRSLVTVA